MTAVFITVYRQRTQPKIYEERSVQGQINQIIHKCVCLKCHLHLTNCYRSLFDLRTTHVLKLCYSRV